MKYVPQCISLSLCLGLLLFWSGCGDSKPEITSKVVASYKDNKLTERMLRHYIPDGVPPKDSIRYAEQFIRQWLKEQSIMDVATKLDPTLAERIEYKVQDYRAKLIMHEYHTQLIEDSLDLEVPMKQIEAYYEANKDNFRSKENLYSYLYVVSTVSDVSEQASWMRSGEQSDFRLLKTWAEANALEFKLDTAYVGETKITQVSKGYFGNLQKADIGKFIRWNGVIQGERRRYLFKMLDKVKSGAPLPVRLCKDKISNLIINDRKNELIERTEEKILKNARANNFIREN